MRKRSQFTQEFKREAVQEKIHNSPVPFFSFASLLPIN